MVARPCLDSLDPATPSTPISLSGSLTSVTVPGALRWGEALHPGPEGDAATDGLFWVGFTNPTGLRNKEIQALNTGNSIISFSETQLSRQTQKSCAARLRHVAQAQNRNLRIHLGCPVSVRSTSQWAGTWSGVATLSEVPSCEVMLPYNGERECGRALATRHTIGSFSLLNVVIYGFPAGPSWPQHKTLTQDLLALFTQEVVLGAKGPRVIGGDMNVDSTQLPVFDLWRRHGWCSAQDYAQTMWNQPKVFTCKGTTERDLLWLSPEAQALCRAVAVHDHFMEHSTISVGLCFPPKALLLRTWPRPSAIPYEALDSAWRQQAEPPVWDDESTVDTQWAQWASSYEQSFQGFAPHQPGGALTKNQQGRLQRTSPLKRRCETLTLRASRPGEVQMRNNLLGQETHCWFRQLRRLQSYLHAIKGAKQTASAIAYRLELWTSIKRASGFKGGFPVWWFTMYGSQHEGLTVLPSAPPDAVVASQIFDQYKQAYERFESWHLRQRGRLLHAKYEKGLSGVFQDLRKLPRDRLDSLHHVHHYGILAVEGTQVHVDQPLQLDGASQWAIDDVPLQVTVLNEVVLDVQQSCEVGDVIVQYQTISDVPALHAELLHYWTPIWNAMPTVPPADWQRIVAFFQAYVPSFGFSLPPITVGAWRKALRRYKKTAARGVDGISHVDLLSMPDPWVERLLQLLQRIEDGTSPWPTAVLYGIVSVIAKDPNSKTVDRFRPIVIFSIIYRTWASIRSTQLLRLLAPHMDSGAYGFLPGCEPSQLWMVLQSDIECHLLAGADLAGLSTDLVRAFNNIPRQHSFALARHIGVPETLLRPWESFLGNCTRAFEIHGWLSDAITSCCGLPEGDALSVYAMVQLNFAWHIYMKAFSPSIRALSFVDNLALVATVPALLARGLACLVEFFRLWNLVLDHQKSYCWALADDMRAQLGTLPFKMVTSARELGGVLSFTRKRFTGQQAKQFLALEPRWHSLLMSWAPFRQKLTMLPVVFWSSALHGIYGSCFGETHLEKLRGKALNALKLKRAGANPLLRLALSPQPGADPAFWRAQQTFRALRRLLRKEPRLMTNWKFFMANFEGQLFSGPFSQLLTVSSQLGWSIHPPYVVDHDGISHHILTLADTTWDDLLYDAWLQYVCQQVRHRTSMNDLVGIDPHLARGVSSGGTALDGALISSLQSGAFMSASQHGKYDLTKTAICAHCQVDDTPLHWLICPRYATLRAAVPGWQDHTNHDTKALMMHLLPSRSPWATDWKHALTNVPDHTKHFLSAPCPGHQHVFVDGTATKTGTPYDIASWGCINATTGLTIATGHVSGLVQSSARAELMAALSALTWQVHFGTDMTLWMDAKYVHDGIDFIQQHGVAADWSDQDLWNQLEDQLEQLAPFQLYLRWIPSHLDVSLLENPYEDWVHLWNGRVDLLVGHYNLNRPADFQHLWQCAQRNHREVSHRLKQLSVFFLGRWLRPPNPQSNPQWGKYRLSLLISWFCRICLVPMLLMICILMRLPRVRFSPFHFWSPCYNG